MRFSLSPILVVVAACGGGTNGGSSAADAPAPDASDPCHACSPAQLCVQTFDGVCTPSVACVTPTVSCPQNACSPACEQAYCPSPTQCTNRVPCGTESPTAFLCYGP